MKESKYFKFRLEELNGEQEYTYDYLIEAGSQAEAEEIAEAYAGSFYDDAPERIDGSYVFFGTIVTEVLSVNETTKERFTSDMLQNVTLTAVAPTCGGQGLGKPI